MDILNNKIQSTQDETLFSAQNVGLYGYDSTSTKWRRVAVNANGELEMTAELDSSGLSTKANQDTVINATLRDINNTGAIGDGSSQATSLSLGYDRSNGQGRAILVDSGGRVEVNSTMNAGHGLATESKQDDIINATNRQISNTDSIGDGSTNASTVALGYDRSGGKGRALNVDGNGRLSVDINSGIPTKTDGTAGHSPATGIGLIGFDSGTANAVHCDSQGALKVKNITSLNVLPADTLNSGTNDNPPNSLAVGLRGRQTITDESTETFLKCSAAGVLEVSSGSSAPSYGGGTAVTSMPSTSGALGDLSSAIDLNGFSSVSIGIKGTAFSGGLTALNNLRLKVSHDNSDYFVYSGTGGGGIAFTILLEEDKVTNTEYTATVQLENLGFRYVKIEQIAFNGVGGSSAYTASYQLF